MDGTLASERDVKETKKFRDRRFVWVLIGYKISLDLGSLKS